LVKHELVRGLKDVSAALVKLANKLKTPILKKMSTNKAFELLHMDLFGPTQYTSIGGNKYDFVIVDDYTRYTLIFFLVDKSDVFTTFKSFVKGIHNELKQPSRELEVTMIVSSRTLELMSCVMTLELDINSRLSTLHNQMVLLRERKEHSLIW
jgi:hypothetical protein